VLSWRPAPSPLRLVARLGPMLISGTALSRRSAGSEHTAGAVTLALLFGLYRLVFGVSQITMGIEAEHGEGSAFRHGRRRLNRASDRDATCAHSKTL
jgi:hypothetical protein